jgi:cytochrome c oxidase subunit 2
MSSLAAPERVWWKPLGKEEKIWVSLALLWALVMFVMMIVWSAVGRQDTPVETYKASAAQFEAAANQFIQQYQVGTEGGMPVVRPPEGSDIYLIAKKWSWSPILKLQKGKTYKLLVSSLDLQHGLSIQPLNLNFQILPGYVFAITLTPTETGEFTIVCNEFCDEGHHLMVGKIIVTE